jgi:translation elongation factor EF-Tu-like GTPase
MLMPGEDSAVELKLVKQMVVEPNQQFTLRAGTSTIGTGKVSCS